MMKKKQTNKPKDNKWVIILIIISVVVFAFAIINGRSNNPCADSCIGHSGDVANCHCHGRCNTAGCQCHVSY